MCVVVGCNPAPTATPTGDVTPGTRVANPEIETTALGGIQARARCGLPAGDAAVFISGGGNFMIRTTMSNLAAGRSGTISFLPGPTATDTCAFETFTVYTPYTDHNVARLPDGRILNVNLYSKRGPAEHFCVEPYPEVERAFVVRVSDDCGATWSIRNIIDATTITGLGSLTYRFIDRQTLFVDTEQQMMYLAFRMAEDVAPNEGGGDNRTVILGAPTTFATTPVWRTVAQFQSNASVTTLTADPHDGSEWLWLFQCDNDGLPVLGLIPTPTRYQPENAAAPIAIATPEPACEIVPGPLTTAQLINRVPQPSIVPMGDQLRLIYPGTVARNDIRYQTAQIVDVRIEQGNFLPYGVVVDQETIDASARGRHVLFPDLVWPEGFEGAAAHAGQQVLTWIEVADASLVPGLESQETHIRAWLPDTQSWWDFGVVAQSVLDGPTLDGHIPRFFGDYRYGTFVDEANTQARYFAPWVQTLPGAATPDAQIFGAVVAE